MAKKEEENNKSKNNVPLLLLGAAGLYYLSRPSEEVQQAEKELGYVKIEAEIAKYKQLIREYNGESETADSGGSGGNVNSPSYLGDRTKPYDSFYDTSADLTYIDGKYYGDTQRRADEIRVRFVRGFFSMNETTLPELFLLPEIPNVSGYDFSEVWTKRGSVLYRPFFRLEILNLSDVDLRIEQIKLKDASYFGKKLDLFCPLYNWKEASYKNFSYLNFTHTTKHVAGMDYLIRPGKSELFDMGYFPANFIAPSRYLLTGPYFKRSTRQGITTAYDLRKNPRDVSKWAELIQKDNMTYFKYEPLAQFTPGGFVINKNQGERLPLFSPEEISGMASAAGGGALSGGIVVKDALNKNYAILRNAEFVEADTSRTAEFSINLNIKLKGYPQESNHALSMTSSKTPTKINDSYRHVYGLDKSVFMPVSNENPQGHWDDVKERLER